MDQTRVSSIESSSVIIWAKVRGVALLGRGRGKTVMCIVLDYFQKGQTMPRNPYRLLQTETRCLILSAHYEVI